MKPGNTSIKPTVFSSVTSGSFSKTLATSRRVRWLIK
uniref:Uncharacterized protein n=1 Tax=Anguilla anguilla TaxID=7936 RepID=A0A0E9PAD8_ANGAN